MAFCCSAWTIDPDRTNPLVGATLPAPVKSENTTLIEPPSKLSVSPLSNGDCVKLAERLIPALESRVSVPAGTGEDEVLPALSRMTPSPIVKSGAASAMSGLIRVVCTS